MGQKMHNFVYKGFCAKDITLNTAYACELNQVKSLKRAKKAIEDVIAVFGKCGKFSHYLHQKK